MINCIRLIYIENNIELLKPIEPGITCDKTRQENDVTDRTSAVYVENETKLLWPIKPGEVYHENQIGK